MLGHGHREMIGFAAFNRGPVTSRYLNLVKAALMHRPHWNAVEWRALGVRHHALKHQKNPFARPVGGSAIGLIITRLGEGVWWDLRSKSWLPKPCTSQLEAHREIGPEAGLRAGGTHELPRHRVVLRHGRRDTAAGFPCAWTGRMTAGPGPAIPGGRRGGDLFMRPVRLR